MSREKEQQDGNRCLEEKWKSQVTWEGATG